MAKRVDAIRAAARREGVEFHWYSPTPLCLFNPIARGLGNKSCAACDGLASLAPNGDLLPCSSYDEPVGNVLREGFRAVWNSPQARFFREKRYAAPICRACESFAACQGACPLYWRAMGCSELPASSPGAKSGNAAAAGAAGSTRIRPTGCFLRPLGERNGSTRSAGAPAPGAASGGSFTCVSDTRSTTSSPAPSWKT